MSAAGLRSFLNNTACTCIHKPKHHKASGRCRKGCECQRARVKALVKSRRRKAAA